MFAQEEKWTISNIFFMFPIINCLCILFEHPFVHVKFRAVFCMRVMVAEIKPSLNINHLILSLMRKLRCFYPLELTFIQIVISIFIIYYIRLNVPI
jgi:hypothetical protein